MTEYYIEIPKRKVDIELPDIAEVTGRSVKSMGRFRFITCADEDTEGLENWFYSNGINFQEM